MITILWSLRWWVAGVYLFCSLYFLYEIKIAPLREDYTA